jgi:exopolysaccharide production protein ExoZ
MMKWRILVGDSTARPEGRPKEILSIQVLRAVAALAVTVAHTYPIVGREFGIETYPTLTTGAAGVDLFFVISGFIMVYTSEELFGKHSAPSTFFLRRLIRIVPLYWTVTTVLLVYFLLRYGSPLEHSTTTIVASYFFVPTADSAGPMAPLLPVGWTLNYEMFFYLSFAMVLIFDRNLAVVVISMLLCAFGLWGRSLALPGPLSVLADPIILEFVFGMLVALAYQGGLKLPKPAALCLIMVGFCVIAASAIVDFASLSRVVVWGIPSACIVAGSVFVGDPVYPNFVWRALGYVGTCSYSLYLTHGLVMNIPKHLGFRFAYSQPALYAVMTVCLAIIFSIATYVVFERPVTTFLRNRFSSEASSKFRARWTWRRQPS